MDHALAARWVFISVWALLEVDSKTSLPENLVGSSGVAVWEVVMWLREEAATDDPMSATMVGRGDLVLWSDWEVVPHTQGKGNEEVLMLQPLNLLTHGCPWGC